jgi:NADH-quinone oxidoreductase subunit J
MTAHQLIFAYLAIAITGLSVMVITRRNPVHAVLWMLVLFVHIAILYLFLNAEFLAAIQIIIYAGAILVLFLFVIMLLDVKDVEMERRFLGLWPAGVVITAILTLLSVIVLREIDVFPPLGQFSIERIRSEGNIMTIGRVLYTRHLLPFEIASLILLVAIIGAVVLAKKRKGVE